MNTDHICYVTMKGDVLVQLTTYISNTTPLKYKTNNFFLKTILYTWKYSPPLFLAPSALVFSGQI